MEVTWVLIHSDVFGKLYDFIVLERDNPEHEGLQRPHSEHVRTNENFTEHPV